MSREAQIVLSPGTKIPTKAHKEDIGWDLTAKELVKDVYGDGLLQMWSTGVAVTPPEGYYYQVTPRSSLAKMGWTVGNSPGIIDPTYTGEVMVILAKIHPKAPPIEAGTRVAQLVLCRAETCTFKEVLQLNQTVRGSGGFGSSGK